MEYISTVEYSSRGRSWSVECTMQGGGSLLNVTQYSAEKRKSVGLLSVQYREEVVRRSTVQR